MNRVATSSGRGTVNTFPRVTTTPSVLVQRSCACGESASLGAKCEDCANGKLKLQRSAVADASHSDRLTAPPIVHDVLRSPGQPLDQTVRAGMEAGFGHDFSRVRVHTDRAAAESARAVNARAFTVGEQIVFGEQQYAAGSESGKQLLAHELVHTIQQRGSVNHRALEVSRPTDSSEHEADAAAAAALDHEKPAGQIATGVPGARDAASVSRSVFAGRPAAVRPAPLQIARQDEGKAKGPAATNHAKRALTAEESKLFAQKIKATPPSGPPMAFVEGTRFVLHDTASRVELKEKERQKVEAEVDEKLKKERAPDAGPKSAEELKQEEELKKEQTEKARLAKERRSLEGHRRGERGPLDEGAVAYVPSEGEAVITRPDFSDPRRPTATQYEKRTDIVTLKDREEGFQKVWKATKPAEQAAALKAAFGGLEVAPLAKESKSATQERAIKERKMTPDEIAGEQAKAKQDLEKALLPDLTKKGTPQIGTSASWAIGKICEKLKSSPAKDLANSEADAKELESGCNQLGAYLDAREPRLKSSVNVEIIQPAGSACETNEKKFTLVPLPAYTENQYQNVALIYLEAALQLGQFPEITTHFWVDRGDPSGHCDPRCFHLPHLFDLVADAAGHPAGSTYGDPPKYGITRGTSNLWWQPKVCGGPHP